MFCVNHVLSYCACTYIQMRYMHAISRYLNIYRVMGMANMTLWQSNMTAFQTVTLYNATPHIILKNDCYEYSFSFLLLFFFWPRLPWTSGP